MKVKFVHGNNTNAARPLVMTADEVSQCLGISTRTIYRLIEQKSLPKPFKVGKSTRWRREDIELFVAEGSMAAFNRAKQCRSSQK